MSRWKEIAKRPAFWAVVVFFLLLGLVTCIYSFPALAPESTMAVYITESGSRYHRDGCRYLAASKIEITKDNAIKRGYEPCSVCDPVGVYIKQTHK